MAVESVYCGISNLLIKEREKQLVYFLPIKKTSYNLKLAQRFYDYSPATLPLLGYYNEDSGITVNKKMFLNNGLVKKNISLIENYFGISIQEFITFLSEKKYYHIENSRCEEDFINNQYIKKTIKKLKANNKYEELKSYDYMFIDAEIYNSFSKLYKENVYNNPDKTDSLISLSYLFGKEYLLNNRFLIDKMILDTLENKNKTVSTYFDTTDTNLISERLSKRENPKLSEISFSDVYFNLENYDLFENWLYELKIIETNMRNISKEYTPFKKFITNRFIPDKARKVLEKAITKRSKELTQC
jgi:hypothetical protein